MATTQTIFNPNRKASKNEQDVTLEIANIQMGRIMWEKSEFVGKELTFKSIL